MTAFIILFMVVFLFLGLPLYIFLFGISIFLFWSSDIPLLSTVVSFQKLQSQEFVYAIPLFTFAGYLLSKSKSPERIINLIQKSLSFLPASASIVVVLVMALFTALTGASGVTILALGGLLFPLLKNSSNSEPFSHGLITSSGSIGLLLAPSLPVIIYTVIANQNISQANLIDLNELFKNALIPSLMIIVSFIIYSFFKEKQRSTNYNWGEAWSKIKVAKWEIPLPFIIYGGIYSGLFTVLEAAFIITFYTFIMVYFIQKDISLRDTFFKITTESLKLSGGIFIIMATAFVLTNYLVYESIPNTIFEWISPYLTNKILFLLCINILLLITGCFLDIFSAILIMLPILLPIAEIYQINPYHFAIIFLVNLEIGYLTPPVGINLFISSYSFKKPITYLYRTIIPFLFILLFILMLITYIPSLSTLFSKNTQTETSLLPSISQVEIENFSEEGVDLIITASSLENTSMIYVYYIDEAEADKTALIDFGELQKFSILDPQQVKIDGRRYRVSLSLLQRGTDYSLIVEMVNKNNQSGIPSSIFSFKTP